tara:strand:+ start:5142 stop:5288 length:147 start_codon:yes stop_codon:yes gene_type:complete
MDIYALLAMGLGAGSIGILAGHAVGYTRAMRICRPRYRRTAQRVGAPE